MRGEQLHALSGSAMSTGSSPHARGTVTAATILRRYARFIPACAGNSVSRSRVKSATTVHPRMRGEQRARWRQYISTVGSSPHARGTAVSGHAVADVARFIPACAGNSHAMRFLPTNPAVHPRMRGEQKIICSSASTADGSSPHARGTGSVAVVIAPERRFIPACAGNSQRPFSRCCSGPVHPRMRGEQHECHLELGGAVGSSPHARGTAGAEMRKVGISRFIPACAGNSLRQAAK